MAQPPTSKPQSDLSCPRCGRATPSLVPVDTGMRLRMQNAGISEQLAPQICPVCYQELTATLSQGAKLRAEEMMKEQNRKILWKNRVSPGLSTISAVIRSLAA